jgi:NAD(P) transhydrogenase subunit alpha
MVRVLIPKETAQAETRVAASPETVAKLVDKGLTVRVQEGAGDASYLIDAEYEKAGAELVLDDEMNDELAQADLLLKVREPTYNEIEQLKAGAIALAHLVPQGELELVEALAAAKVTFFSMNLVPRITRAQKMDALSSQANIAGYKAALLAAGQLPKYFPLLMTAAGTVKPAKVVVMGAGVAGLQAIATCKRLGAQVWASDVRLAAKEQVESLGAKFIDIPGMEDLEDERGYAKPPTPEFLERQRKIVGDHVTEADAVITTALVPGRKAPVLVPSPLVRRMKPGAVIVDLAAEQGGNCEETVPGETVVRHGVTVLGPRNIPGTVSMSASELYARNVLAFVLPLLNEQHELHLDFEDEVVDQSAVTHDGKVHHGPTAEALAKRDGDAPAEEASEPATAEPDASEDDAPEADDPKKDKKKNEEGGDDASE